MYHCFCFTEEKVRQRGEKTCLNISEQFSSRSQNRSSLSGLTCPTLDLLISNWNFALFAGVTLSCLHSMWLFIYYSLLNNGLKLSQIFLYYYKKQIKKSPYPFCAKTLTHCYSPFPPEFPPAEETSACEHSMCIFTFHLPNDILHCWSSVWGAEMSSLRVIYGWWSLSPPRHWF